MVMTWARDDVPATSSAATAHNAATSGSTWRASCRDCCRDASQIAHLETNLGVSKRRFMGASHATTNADTQTLALTGQKRQIGESRAATVAKTGDIRATCRIAGDEPVSLLPYWSLFPVSLVPCISNLHQPGSGRRGRSRPHRRLMLRARGRIQIDRNSAGHNHRRVVAEVQIARDAIRPPAARPEERRSAASCRRAQTRRR